MSVYAAHHYHGHREYPKKIFEQMEDELETKKCK
jgi:hypothetical protein